MGLKSSPARLSIFCVSGADLALLLQRVAHVVQLRAELPHLLSEVSHQQLAVRDHGLQRLFSRVCGALRLREPLVEVVEVEGVLLLQSLPLAHLLREVFEERVMLRALRGSCGFVLGKDLCAESLQLRVGAVSDVSDLRLQLFFDFADLLR